MKDLIKKLLNDFVPPFKANGISIVDSRGFIVADVNRCLLSRGDDASLAALLADSLNHSCEDQRQVDASERVESLLNALTDDERQLLKDTINFGRWGDTDMDFLNADGEIYTDYAWGYCTNDAKDAGNFEGRKISAMFRSIYKKLCPAKNNQIGSFLTHYNDWWGDGSGDMLFIHYNYKEDFEIWARMKKAVQKNEIENACV